MFCIDRSLPRCFHRNRCELDVVTCRGRGIRRVLKHRNRIIVISGWTFILVMRMCEESTTQWSVVVAIVVGKDIMTTFPHHLPTHAKTWILYQTAVRNNNPLVSNLLTAPAEPSYMPYSCIYSEESPSRMSEICCCCIMQDKSSHES